MCDNDAYTDVVELCALLQCLGFSVKSLDANDGNASSDGGARTVVINCQASGLHVVLESASMPCFCPALSQQNGGMWQVTAVSGGKHLDKEFGCTLLGSLPKAHRERLTSELREIIRCIKQNNESVSCDLKRDEKCASTTDLKTPEKLSLLELEVETPTRYRSLDTLTSKSKIDDLPAPGSLQRTRLPSGCEDAAVKSPKVYTRQGTYMLSSTPGASSSAGLLKNKTSSPIQLPHFNILDTLVSAQRAIEDVHSKLTSAIQKIHEDNRDDSSMSSLALDVSKISLLKAEGSKAQFASSPNLTGLAGPEDLTKNRLRRQDSASTSKLDQRSAVKESKLARLRRFSPNIFKTDSSAKSEKGKDLDGKNKLRSLLKPKIVTPVRLLRSPLISEPSPNRSRNKFSHVKSTIPRPAKKEYNIKFTQSDL